MKSVYSVSYLLIELISQYLCACLLCVAGQVLGGFCSRGKSNCLKWILLVDLCLLLCHISHILGDRQGGSGMGYVVGCDDG